MKKSLKFNFAKQIFSLAHSVMHIYSIWYQKVTCKHKIRTIQWIDYQDRYIRYKCDKCGKDIYNDI